jgi:hypothetical protein
MSAPFKFVSDLPSAVGQYLETAEFVLFRLTLFGLFVLALYRLFRGEWKKK